MMPSTILRLSLNGCPLRPAFDGSNGAICAHCSSVRHRNREEEEMLIPPPSRQKPFTYRRHALAKSVHRMDRDSTVHDPLPDLDRAPRDGPDPDPGGGGSRSPALREPGGHLDLPGVPAPAEPLDASAPPADPARRGHPRGGLNYVGLNPSGAQTESPRASPAQRLSGAEFRKSPGRSQF